MPIEHDEEHVAEADALFIDQFKEKPRLSALLAAFTARIQDAEDALWDVYFRRLIDNAEGIQLDTIGKLVGQPRIGTDDGAYRLFIRTRIRANMSRGRPDDIVQVAAIAMTGLRFDYLEYYPASFVVDVLDALPAYQQFIFDIIMSAKPVGVGWSLDYMPNFGSDVRFRFSSTDVEEDDAVHGMSDEDPDFAGGLLMGTIST